MMYTPVTIAFCILIQTAKAIGHWLKGYNSSFISDLPQAKTISSNMGPDIQYAVDI
jgi:hypothetical protein